MCNKELLIYIVDDDPFFHLYMDMCLDSYKKNCLHFYDGAEFISYLENTKISNKEKKQILFTDIQMPVMNGLEVLIFLKKNGYDYIHKNVISSENKNFVSPPLLDDVDNFFDKFVSVEQVSFYLKEKLMN